MSLPGYEEIPGLTEKVLRAKQEFVRRLLSFHPFGNPAKGKKIAVALGISHVQVRTLRRVCWKDGIAVGSGKNGYFLARKPEELDSTIKHIRARVYAEQQNLSMILRIQERLQTGNAIDESQESLSL